MKSKNLAHYHATKHLKANQDRLDDLQESPLSWPPFNLNTLLPTFEEHLNKHPLEGNFEMKCKHIWDAFTIVTEGGGIRGFGEGLLSIWEGVSIEKTAFMEWKNGLDMLFIELERLQVHCHTLVEHAEKEKEVDSDHVAWEVNRDIGLVMSILQEIIVASDQGHRYLIRLYQKQAFTFQCM